MRQILTGLGLLVALTACYNRHVNGSGYREPLVCAGEKYVVVNNGTPRTYDIYVGNQIIGTADPRRTTRFRLDVKYHDSQLQLREVKSATDDIKGPRLDSRALRVVCE